MKYLSALLLFFPVTIVAAADTPSTSHDDRTALEIGKAIIAVDDALAYNLPENPSPTETAKSQALTDAMVKAGQVTRLYPWVSARITLEITTAESLLKDTHPDPQQARKLNRRIEYLKHVKFLIDAPL